MSAKAKNDLGGSDIELAYYTSELRLCTAIYKYDIYGNFVFMDWKNRTMTSEEMADYNNRLMGNTGLKVNLDKLYTEKEYEIFKKHIQEGKISHVYLLYGEEQYVIKIIRDKLLKALLGTSLLETLKQNIDFSLFTGSHVDISKVIEIALTYPLLSGKKVILIEDSDVLSKNSTAFIKCIKNLPETTYIILVEKKKYIKGEFLSVIKERGYAIEINEQQKEIVEKWVIYEL